MPPHLLQVHFTLAEHSGIPNLGDASPPLKGISIYLRKCNSGLWYLPVNVRPYCMSVCTAVHPVFPTYSIQLTLLLHLLQDPILNAPLLRRRGPTTAVQPRP